MFTYDDGLMLTTGRLWVDCRRRQPRSFVSHAHADHMARHELALCTPETGALYQHRLGKRPVREMAFGEPMAYGGLQLTALPAGHCLGSAMLLAEEGDESLLYTGDYKLGPSLTSVEADPPAADILVMETTFGRPDYRLPPRDEVIAQFIEVVRAALADGRTPVVHAYALGKSQEATKILTTHGIPVLQHPMVWGVSQVYERCGMALGTGDADVAEYAGRPLAGHAVVTLPRSMRQHRLAALGSVTSIALTGWAAGREAPFRLNVDHALPLSDHADYEQLLQLVERVNPQRICCTHGPKSFVDDLRERGWNAEPLERQPQQRLF